VVRKGGDQRHVAEEARRGGHRGEGERLGRVSTRQSASLKVNRGNSQKVPRHSLTSLTPPSCRPCPVLTPLIPRFFPLLWFPLTASLLSTGTRGLSLANAPGVVPLSSAQVRLFFSLLFFHLLTVSFPPPTFSLNLASPSPHLTSHVPLSPRVAPRHASVASPPRHASLLRHASRL
jgi:hypothetical protein